MSDKKTKKDATANSNVDQLLKTDPSQFSKLVRQNPEAFDGIARCKANYIYIGDLLTENAERFPAAIEELLNIKIARDANGSWRKDESGKLYGYIPWPLSALHFDSFAIKDSGLKNKIESYRSENVNSCGR